MGLLTKIIGTDPVATPPAAATLPPTTPAQAGAALNPSTTPTWPNPLPCPVCSSAIFYRDVYGGGPHCRGCKPVVGAMASLVQNFLWVLWSVADSKWFWTGDPRNPRGPDGQLLDGMGSMGGNVDDDGLDPSAPPPLRTITIDDRNGRTGRTWLVTAADVSPRDAARGRLDLLRLAGTGGTGDGLGEVRYSPPRGCGPVGDMLLDEWFESLPEGLPGWGR